MSIPDVTIYRFESIEDHQKIHRFGLYKNEARPDEFVSTLWEPLSRDIIEVFHEYFIDRVTVEDVADILQDTLLSPLQAGEIMKRLFDKVWTESEAASVKV